MKLVQFIDQHGERRVAVRESSSDTPRVVKGARSTRELALEAARKSTDLASHVRSLGFGEAVDYDKLVAEDRLLLPLDHPDEAHVVLAITGLTHLGSATSRDAMHAKLQSADLSDSMKMFKLGLEGGRPKEG